MEKIKISFLSLILTLSLTVACGDDKKSSDSGSTGSGNTSAGAATAGGGSGSAATAGGGTGGAAATAGAGTGGAATGAAGGGEQCMPESTVGKCKMKKCVKGQTGILYVNGKKFGECPMSDEDCQKAGALKAAKDNNCN